MRNGFASVRIIGKVIFPDKILLDMEDQRDGL